MMKADLNKKVSFFDFVYVWMRLQGLKVPKHQSKMARWLSELFITSKQRQGLLMAFRNSGKSTIVGLFCAWVLYYKPETRILVMAADHALAKKMVRNVKRIIEQHPLTKGLKPQKSDQWAAGQFTINRPLELRDPSMLAKGLGANITGLRADLIICDDVEVPKNSDSPAKRADMREKLEELDYILTPEGMQLYIGTPHTFYTIYQVAYDDKKPETEPFLLGFAKLELPILNKKGKSAWPERFSEEKIASIRIRSGENKFLSQMMLTPVNFNDSILNPDCLKPYEAEINIVASNGRDFLKIEEKKMLSASCWWDPSFASSKGDNSVIACVFTDEDGHYWLHDLEYIKIEDEVRDYAASVQCQKVAAFIERNHLNAVRVEANGIGKFLPGILKQVLAQKNMRVAVLEMYSSKNKAERIISAFEVLLAERALNVHKKIWSTPFIEEMREFSVDGTGHDDALDAVAGCLNNEPLRLNVSFVGNTSPKYNKWQGGSKQFSAQTTFTID